MNDEFLKEFRKSPRREFSATLFERINKPMNKNNGFSFRRLAFATVICFVMIGSFMFLPNVRAAVSDLMQEIGGILYLAPEETEAQVPTTSEEDVVIVPEETLSLEDAKAKLPFEVSLPTWAPEGFVMSDSVRITYFSDEFTPVSISWWSDDMTIGPIELTVGKRVNWVVDLEAVQEVQVNGQPAGLTVGGWDVNLGEWAGDDLTLMWMKGEVMYELYSPNASQEDLIRMAESIP